MRKTRSTISKGASYEQISEFWDTHDLADYWDKTRPADFDVQIESEVTYYALESQLSAKVRSIALRRGVLPETLPNLWVQEKLRESATTRLRADC
jgi:hypothetical protein